MQQSFQKSQIFQTRINSQQNDVPNYHVEPPSRFYTPPKINYSACEQLSFKPYSTPKPNSQQYFSMCIPQSFRNSTSYNHQLNQFSSIISPPNISKLSSTHLPPQLPLFSSKNVRPLRTVSRSGKQSLVEGVGRGDKGLNFQKSNAGTIVNIKADAISYPVSIVLNIYIMLRFISNLPYMQYNQLNYHM